MLVIRIGPRTLTLLGMAAALALGLVIGSLHPMERAGAAEPGAAPLAEVLAQVAPPLAGLTYAQAVRMIDAAMAEAQSKGYPSSFAVLDAGGHLIAAGRMDGAPLNTMEFARGKAYASAVSGRSSGALQESYNNNPALWGNAATIGYNGPLLPARGALPIVLNGMTVGAMGGSGGPAQEDENSVRVGLAAIGMQ